MIDDLAVRAREGIGRGARVWAPPQGHQVNQGWWKAMTGASSLALNVVLCHGGDPAQVADALAAVSDAGCPTTVMLAGESLGDAQLLVDAGWVCLGTTPVMGRDDVGRFSGEIDTRFRQASDRDLEAVRSIVAESFFLDRARAELAVPRWAGDAEDCGIWVIDVDGEIRSAVLTAVVGEVLVFWMMATPPRWRRQGYGALLLENLFVHYARRGVTTTVMYSSPAGESFYRRLGLEVIEYWQLWSRPRWALGRS